jgi:hypothetical protein
LVDFLENTEKFLCKGFSKTHEKENPKCGIGMHTIPGIPTPFFYILTREVRGIGLLNPHTGRHVRLLDSPIYDSSNSKKLGFIPNIE